MHVYRLRNNRGAYVEVADYGATLVSFVIPGRDGMSVNLILSCENREDYLTDTFYLGSTVGRYANRISNARFSLNGVTHLLDKNDGNNSNHGGFNGFHTKLFGAEEKAGKLVLSCQSPDGEGGFPGNLSFSVTYALSDDNTLEIEYRAVSDRETVFNPTSHAYFNLSGHKKEILDHELKVFADRYLETDHEFIPTGRILPVKNSAFDFREYKTIAAMMSLKKEPLKGYNTCFSCHPGGELKQMASLRDPSSGNRVTVSSTMPGIQVYTGDYLSGKHRPFTGIALEAQFFPDAPNHPEFKNCILKPGIHAIHKITFEAAVF